jgi:hypothetical protein
MVSVLLAPQSGEDGVPTQSVGTRKNGGLRISDRDFS